MKTKIRAPIVFACSAAVVVLLSIYMAWSELVLAGVSFLISLFICKYWLEFYLKAKASDDKYINKNKGPISGNVNFAGLFLLVASQSALLLWGNSISPLWGDGLEQKQEWAAIIARADNEAKTNSDREFDLKFAAKEAVKSALKDPSSATFSSLSVNSSTGVVCGKVNSKNGLGGMSGYQNFIYDGSVYLAETDKDIQTRWQSMCN